MQIKLYEEKKKTGQTGRILIILDDPGADLTEFVKKYVTSLGGKTTATGTVSPEKNSEPIPEVPETQPDVQVTVSQSQTDEEEELFPDVSDPAPQTKQPEQKPEQKPAEKPAEAPAEQNSGATGEFAEIQELWEMIDDDSKEEILANYGAGSLEDIDPDYYPNLLDDLKALVFG